MLDVVEWGGGNTGSLERALSRLGLEFRRVREPSALAGGNPLVLPGVGSFAGVMRGLSERGLDAALTSAVRAGRPLLGVCVGLQVLFERSEESPGVRGLCLLGGEVVRFAKGKVPQVGWNSLEPAEGADWPRGHAYFVNSYFARPATASDVLYISDYSGPFCAAVRRGNVTAFQFHPEKSGPFGSSLLKRWADAL